jgi:hypothetical protein
MYFFIIRLVMIFCEYAFAMNATSFPPTEAAASAKPGASAIDSPLRRCLTEDLTRFS